MAGTVNKVILVGRLGKDPELRSIPSGTSVAKFSLATDDRFTDFFGNAGLGWRFTPNILGEYIFSTDFGQTSPRHTFMLRYTFGGGEK